MIGSRRAFAPAEEWLLRRIAQRDLKQALAGPVTWKRFARLAIELRAAPTLEQRMRKTRWPWLLLVPVFLLGITLAVEEGIEVNLLGMTFGIDPLELGIKLPFAGDFALLSKRPAAISADEATA